MKRLLIGSAIIIGTSGIVSYNLTRPISAESDLPTKVQHQGEQLANHEARITNAEKDIKGLQDNTNTPPSNNPVPVPVVAPESASPEPTDNTIRVTAAVQRKEELPRDESHPARTEYYCDLTYSDGSQESRLMGISSGQGSTFPDNCSDFIGQPKTT